MVRCRNVATSIASRGPWIGWYTLDRSLRFCFNAPKCSGNMFVSVFPMLMSPAYLSFVSFVTVWRGKTRKLYNFSTTCSAKHWLARGNWCTKAARRKLVCVHSAPRAATSNRLTKTMHTGRVMYCLRSFCFTVAWVPGGICNKDTVAIRHRYHATHVQQCSFKRFSCISILIRGFL